MFRPSKYTQQYTPTVSHCLPLSANPSKFTFQPQPPSKAALTEELKTIPGGGGGGGGLSLPSLSLPSLSLPAFNAGVDGPALGLVAVGGAYVAFQKTAEVRLVLGKSQFHASNPRFHHHYF